MADPVMDRHGHNFERAAILDWLARAPECPMSRCPIHPDDLFPNLALREDIELWLAAHPDAPEAAPPLPPGGYPMKEVAIPERSVPSMRARPALALPLEALVSSPPREEPSGAEAPSDALPWLRLHIPQEEYDTLATLFYSFCTPSGIMTLAEAQRLLQYMNYHDAVGALGLSEATVSLSQFVTFAIEHRPQPADYGLSAAEYQKIVQQFRQFDATGRGTLDSPSLRTLCAALHVDDQPLGLPEAPAALLTCHEFLGRLRDARRAALASTAAAAGAPVPRGRAASMPLVPVTPRSAGPRPRPLEREGMTTPRVSPRPPQTLQARSPQLPGSLSLNLLASPSPRHRSPRLSPTAQPGVPVRRVSDTLAFPVHTPKAASPSGAYHSPRSAMGRVHSDQAGRRSPPPSPA
eukprot:EG_transcript_15011